MCSNSQSEEPVVTPAGDIQMQTFSVTKKVSVFVIYLVAFVIRVTVTITYIQLLLHLYSRRETALTTWKPQLSSQVLYFEAFADLCVWF